MENLKKEGIGSIRGVLWYQGCNEAGANETSDYESLFLSFLDTVGAVFKDNSLPVITFQLNRFFAGTDYALRDEGYKNIREIQREIANKYENVYLVPTIDLKTMSDDIHNSVSSNKPLAERTAMYALDESIIR